MDPDEDLTLVGRIGVDRSMAAQVAGGRGERVEAEDVLRLAGRAVTDKTFIRKNRKNLACEIDGRSTVTLGGVKHINRVSYP